MLKDLINEHLVKSMKEKNQLKVLKEEVILSEKNSSKGFGK